MSLREDILSAMQECHDVGAENIFARDISAMLNISEAVAVRVLNKMAVSMIIDRETIGGGYLYKVKTDKKRPRKQKAKNIETAKQAKGVEEFELKMDTLDDLSAMLAPAIGAMLKKISNDITALNDLLENND